MDPELQALLEYLEANPWAASIVQADLERPPAQRQVLTPADPPRRGTSASNVTPRQRAAVGDPMATGARAMARAIRERPVRTALDFTPVVGDAISLYDGGKALAQGDLVGGALGALGALPFIPGFAGRMARQTPDVSLRSKETGRQGLDDNVDTFLFDTPEGPVEVVAKRDGDVVDIGWVGAPGGSHREAPVPIGAGNIRQVLSRVAEEYPGATAWRGQRATGARASAGRGQETVEAPIPRSLVPDPARTIRRVLGNGKHLDISIAGDRFTATIDGKQAAVGSLGRQGDQTFVQDLLVPQAMRRQGIGRAVFDGLEEATGGLARNPGVHSPGGQAVEDSHFNARQAGDAAAPPPEMLTLRHFGPEVDNIDTLDPAKQFSGQPGAERRRAENYKDDYLPRTHLYEEGTPVEPRFQGQPSVEVQVPRSAIASGEDVQAAVRQAAEELGEPGGPGVVTRAERILKDRGFEGYSQDGVVQKFTPTPLGGVDRTAARMIAGEDGGFTLDPRTGESAAGRDAWAVAPRKDTERVFDRPPTPAEIRAYREEWSDLLSEEGAHLGGWHDREAGRYVLDVSKLYDDEAAAIQAAATGQQDAIFHLGTFETKPVDARAVAGAIGDSYGDNVAERVRAAAWRSADGRVFEGVHHGEAEEAMRAAGVRGSTDSGERLGFTTSTGRFIDREEANYLARSANQVNPKVRAVMGPRLTSEQLLPEGGAAGDNTGIRFRPGGLFGPLPEGQPNPMSIWR